jgi:cyclopropane fatty-acyl-phospholipid synthase-like methyltransferase
MFAADDDPWRFRSRWYESRKRAMTLACLPKPHYESAFEPGCANGELSAALASRCDRLIASDGSSRAVALARARTAGSPHVQVRQAWVPDEWPEERFDLIVISELGYFLSRESLDALALKAKGSLLAGGTLMACHWRRGSDDCALTGDDVHACLEHGLALPRVTHLLEADFRIDVWCDDARSVAQREGFASSDEPH